MPLTALDQARLDGKFGKTIQLAMQTVVAAAMIDQADSLCCS